MAQIAKAGLLADLSDQAWTKTIPANFKPAFQQDGKTYIYSAGSVVIGAIYNKKVFAEAGIDALPTTWTEFLEVCEKLKKAGKVPIALGAQTPWVTQLITYALVPSTVYAKDPDFDEQDGRRQASFADSGWRDAMEMYLELQKRGYFNDNPNGTTLRAADRRWSRTGKAAMAIQVSAVLPDFRNAATSADDLSMFPVPGADDADQVWIPAGVVVGLGVERRSKNARRGQGVHRVPRRAGEHQPLGRGGRRVPLDRRTRAPRSTRCWTRSCRSPKEQGGAVHGPALAQRRGAAGALRGRPGAARRRRPRSPRR